MFGAASLEKHEYSSLDGTRLQFLRVFLANSCNPSANFCLMGTFRLIAFLFIFGAFLADTFVYNDISWIIRFHNLVGCLSLVFFGFLFVIHWHCPQHSIPGDIETEKPPYAWLFIQVWNIYAFLLPFTYTTLIFYYSEASKDLPFDPAYQAVIILCFIFLTIESWVNSIPILSSQVVLSSVMMLICLLQVRIFASVFGFTPYPSLDWTVNQNRASIGSIKLWLIHVAWTLYFYFFERVKLSRLRIQPYRAVMQLEAVTIPMPSVDPVDGV